MYKRSDVGAGPAGQPNLGASAALNISDTYGPARSIPSSALPAGQYLVSGGQQQQQQRRRRQ